MMSKLIKSVSPLSFPNPTLDPFLFMVYHKDNYPAGNDKMQAPIRGNGAHFDPDAEYRMYHGDTVPGFPQHPHRGFETLTATLEGLIDHTDSLGCGGRYGGGDLQWMTAGKGIVHGENFPLVNAKGPNTCRFFQIWLNLPADKKMSDPTYVMHWNEKIPRIQADGTTVTLWAGSLLQEGGGLKGLTPPPDSWASNPSNDVTVIHLSLAKDGGSFTVPASIASRATRMAYWVEGKGPLEVGSEKPLTSKCAIVLDAAQQVKFTNKGSDPIEVLVLGGAAIDQPVAQRGPFVMNTQQEIMQAFQDYQKTRFGGWPWEEDAVVFPREKGRFSTMNGVEERP